MQSHLTIKVAAALVLLFLSSRTVKAQAGTQYDKGTPPQHATGVSPLGSYISTEIGTVSLSNGALNISLPLATVGGRGFSIPISLNYSSKVWSVSKETTLDMFYANDVVVPIATYGWNAPGIYQGQLPGWSIGGTPMMKKQVVVAHRCVGESNQQSVITKLTAVMPDGAEIELRDDSYDGSPRVVYPCIQDYDVPRSLRWHATDGSGTIFLFDSQTSNAGTLITADGTRYRFDSIYTPTVSITDRNGNQISINRSIDPNNWAHETVEYIDQLGRSTKVELNAADPANSSVTLAALVTVKGYQGTPRYYKVRSDLMGNLIRSDLNYNHLPILTGNEDNFGRCYQGNQPPAANYLFPESYCQYQQRLDDRDQVSELDLPDGRSLQFKYNLYGEVAEVTLPTGAKLQYDYAPASGFPSGNTLDFERSGQYNYVDGTDRAITDRRTYENGTTLETTWTYAFGPANCSSYPCVDVKAYAGDSNGGTLLLNQRHYFLPQQRDLQQEDFGADGTGYSLWSTALERRVETRDASGNVISAVENDWSQRAPVNWPGFSCCQFQIANDNRVNETRRYLDNGSFAKTDTVYDAINSPRSNNVIEVQEYDFDGSLKRRSTTAYVTGSYQTDDSIHLLSLPLTQTIYDGSNNQVAQATNEYDNYANDGNHDALLDYGAVIGHDGNYNAARTARGNLTATGRWLNTNNSIIYSYLRYDILGNPVGNKDARGNLTTLSYADDFGDGSNPGGGGLGANGATYALPTLITSPPPQAGQPQHTARSQYDFLTGLLTGFKDRNGVVTQSFYNDPFDRPVLVKAGLNTSVETHTRMYYAPATTEFGITLSNNDVLIAKDQTNLDDKTLRSWTKTDGFGRTVESWSRDPQGDVEVKTIYDALSRAKQVSNPFRPSQESPVYTATNYDFAGRVTSVTTSDSAAVVTDYSANTVTVTDQAGKKRKSVTDALGRLKEVYEDPNGLNYLTSYSYDALDNLITVNQGSQTRSFVYDSLKRLMSATNPESGTVGYQYDNNGNLLTKTDARSITSSYSYDALNRPISKSYNDNPQTPTVTYTYDSAGVSNSKGRLSSVSSSVSTYSYAGYDALGRPLGTTETIGSQNYSITNLMYDLAGHIRSMTYPSGHTVTNTFDSAGRLSSFAGSLGDGTTQRTYSTGITYSPFGGMTREQYGTTPTPLYNKTFYNVRGQMFDRRVSSVNDTWDWNRGWLVLYYESNHLWGQSSTTNNGNLIYEDTWVPSSNGDAQILFQDDYHYDSLNRLSSTNESSLDFSTGVWTARFAQGYDYDRYGNRKIKQDPSDTWGTGTPKPDFGVNTGTNQLTAPAGYSMTYDNAGNLTNDTYTGQGTRTYDAENRMKQAWANNQWQTYAYDGNGHRIKRIANGTETWQVYGLGGELIAEYAANAAPTNPQKEYGYRNGELLITTEPSANVHWLVTDQLGTPRMVFDQTGSLAGVSRHDYLPFGEELFAGTGGRTTAQGYSASDGVRQHFTDKERDNETGLDYFLARYYSSTQGRFTSPDEFASGPVELLARTGDSKKQAIPYAEVTQPQSLNKYSYVYNNPCRYTDPDGHCGTPSGLKPGQVGICVASYIASKFVPPLVPPGLGDNRGPNGQGGTSRIEVRVVVDLAKGSVTKTDEAMGTSSVGVKGVGLKGTGGVDVSQPGKDEKGNIYFQVHQMGTSKIAGVLGSIENHLNMVVTTDGRVGITPSSTAKDYPSLEVYKYTMDDKGNVTTTLIKAKPERAMIDLSRKEKPIRADPQ